MRQVIATQLDCDLKPVAGRALADQCLKALQLVPGRLDAALPVKDGVASSNIMRSRLGLLVQGKSHFDMHEHFRGDSFFMQVPGVALLQSSRTPRRRLDARAAEKFAAVAQLIETGVSDHRTGQGVLPRSWLPLGLDTFAVDNSGNGPRGHGLRLCGLWPAGGLSGQPLALP